MSRVEALRTRFVHAPIAMPDLAPGAKPVQPAGPRAMIAEGVVDRFERADDGRVRAGASELGKRGIRRFAKVQLPTDECGSTGACLQSCATTDDCAGGSSCDTTSGKGLCVPTATPPAPEPAPCGCWMPGVERSGSYALLAIGALAATLPRRRSGKREERDAA